MPERSAVGLDLDRCQINMVSLVEQESGLRLVNFSSFRLNPRLSAEARAAQLGRMAQEKGFVSLPVNIGVSGESVIVRYIDLPRMKD
ncbi:hypothetical protein ACFL1I_08410, partial [Candidatus Omnitrophota bacterium]